MVCSCMQVLWHCQDTHGAGFLHFWLGAWGEKIEGLKT